MKKIKRVLMVVIVIMFGLLASTYAASGNFSFLETFSAPESTNDWVKTIDVITMYIHSSERYRIYYSAGTDSSSRSLSYTGASDDATPVSSGDWLNYTVSAEFEESNIYNNSGVYARWQGSSTDPNNRNAYFAYRAGSNLKIGKGLSTYGECTTVLASSSLTATFQVDHVYRIEFTVNGSNLSAKLFDGSTEIGSVTTTDSDYTQGSVGIRSYLTAENRNTYFDNVNVTGIPPAGTLIIIQ